MTKCVHEFKVSLGPEQLKRLSINADYDLHALVYSLFDDGLLSSEPSLGRLLYADKGWIGGQRIVTVRAPIPPDLDRCAQRAITPEVSLVPCDYPQGSLIRFSLIFNALARSRRENKRTTFQSEEEALHAFSSRMCSMGLTLNGADAHEALSMYGARRIEVRYKTGSSFSLSQCFIGGVATVSNSSFFSTSLRHGVGRGRAFGCGLLMASLLKN